VSKATSDYDHFVVVPDLQWPFEHKRSEAAVMGYVADVKPDKVFLVGDAIDFTSLGSYLKKVPPSKRLYLSGEIKYARKKLAQWTAVSRGAELYYLEGNHEYRFARKLETDAPELYDLVADPCKPLTLRNLLLLDEMGWKYIEPYGAGMWIGRPGGLWITHGQYCGENAITQMLKLVKCSFIQGHDHRLASKAQTSSLTGKTIAGYTAGTLCDSATTPRATAHVNWQHGFIHGWVHRKRKTFHVDLVSINDGRFVVGGKEYRG